MFIQNSTTINPREEILVLNNDAALLIIVNGKWICRCHLSDDLDM
jgi:hypothetical protein